MDDSSNPVIIDLTDDTLTEDTKATPVMDPIQKLQDDKEENPQIQKLQDEIQKLKEEDVAAEKQDEKFVTNAKEQPDADVAATEMKA